MLSAICRPLADPIISTYLRIKLSMIVAVSPVSSIALGSAGRKLSSERIEASRLLPVIVAEPTVSVTDITHDSAIDAKGAITEPDAAGTNSLSRRVGRAKIAYGSRQAA